MPTYRLSASAEADIDGILFYTVQTFGDAARRRYEALIAAGLVDITLDPERPGSTARPQLGSGVRTYHLRYSRKRAQTGEGFVQEPRHLLLYRFVRAELIGVGRVLHDSSVMSPTP